MSATRRVRDFQKTDPHLRTHPAFLKFRRRMDIDANMAHGILSGLWAFSFSFAQDGDLSRFSGDDIAISIDYQGDGEQLLAALEHSGFLSDDGKLRSWGEWGGALFTERTYEAATRQDRRYREKQRKQEELSGGQERTKPDCPTRREEIREEKIKSVVDYAAEYELWWLAFGRVGNKNEGYAFWQQWVKRGASTDDLTTAATNYRASNPAFPQYQWNARTFLATKNKEGMEVNRWHEWVNPEPRAMVTGNGQPAEAPRDGFQWKRFTDYDERGNVRDEWREVPA